MEIGRRAARLVACSVVLLTSLGALAQIMPYDGGRAYNQCANSAARNAGPPPRTDPRPGDDLAMLERRRQDHADRYYRALDQCLRDADRRRVPRD